MRHRPEAQIALIHGSGLTTEADGRVYPSAETQGNLAVGLDLLRDKRVEKLLVSGAGPLHNVDYGRDTEAELGADWLVRQGVNHKEILIETISTSTVGNWAHSAEVIEREGLEAVAGVARSSQVIRAHRIGNHVASGSDFEVVGYAASRENFRSASGRAVDFGREAASLMLFELFCQKHPNCPREDMEYLYDSMKESFGFAAIKRRSRR